MNQILVEIGVVLLLLTANGAFAMAEIAVVSSRKTRLRKLAREGRSAAAAALALAESPTRFLATVQVGITLVGILAGAFGGATLAEKLEPALATAGLPAPWAGRVAFAMVVACLTYLSLVIGELIPKHVGLSNPEKIAMLVARPMNALSRLASPLVSLLTGSTELVLRLAGFRAPTETAVSEDEVRTLMQEGMRAGAFNRVEGHIVQSALELDQVPVRQIMTPRAKVIWLRADESHEMLWHKIVVSGHSYFPVYSDTRDTALGIVSLKAIYANLAAGVATDLKNLVTPPLVVPETQNAVQLLETFKQTGKHVALVTDEFGHIIGMVTLHDVMEVIVGDMPSPEERARPDARKREDGTWLVDALIDLESLEGALPGLKLEPAERGNAQTLAGYLLQRLGRVPHEGEIVRVHAYSFEVLDMDGHRIDKVLVTPDPPKG